MNLIQQYDMLLASAELLLNSYQDKVINNDFYQEGQRVICICKEWTTNNMITADDIYDTVNSENGYDIVEFSYFEGIAEEESYMWILLTDIVCALCSLAYQMENQKYVPQAIECIKDHKIGDFSIFLNKNMKVHHNIKECVEYFSKNVCY